MRRVGLLVSVRDEEEAEAALAGGADIIDIKEPARGSLGQADASTIRAIVQKVARRVPVSAALGEWDEGIGLPAVALDFVKWGPAQGARRLKEWSTFVNQRPREGPQFVHVAYADWECAQAPSVEYIADLACREAGNLLLLDTHCKEAVGFGRKPTLLDWIDEETVRILCKRCRASGVRVALAGSLGPEEIERLLPAQPDWFAVRGAVCEEGCRQARVCADRVGRLSQWIRKTSLSVY